MSAAPYYLCYMIPSSYFLGLFLGGWYLLLPAALAFVVVPILDIFGGLDEENLSKSQEDLIKNAWSFRLVTLLWVPTQISVVIFGAWFAATQALSWYEFAFLVIGAGVNNGGLGFTISHELCHRQSKLEQWSSQLILCCVNYAHFHIEHVYGHHQRVATPEDPATSKINQSVYPFLWQTVKGSWLSAWRFEAKRVRVRKKSAWRFQNRMINYILVQAAITAILSLAFGLKGLFFHLGQSLVSIMLLEVINYVEHYGLERKMLDNGKYEKVLPRHSWNANHRISNIFLFRLQRHSDHHANANRRYQILRNFPEAPQLPFGYPMMVLMALVPPLYRRFMNPMVHAHSQSI